MFWLFLCLLVSWTRQNKWGSECLSEQQWIIIKLMLSSSCARLSCHFMSQCCYPKTKRVDSLISVTWCFIRSNQFYSVLQLPVAHHSPCPMLIKPNMPQMRKYLSSWLNTFERANTERKSGKENRRFLSSAEFHNKFLLSRKCSFAIRLRSYFLLSFMIISEPSPKYKQNCWQTPTTGEIFYWILIGSRVGRWDPSKWICETLTRKDVLTVELLKLEPRGEFRERLQQIFWKAHNARSVSLSFSLRPWNLTNKINFASKNLRKCLNPKRNWLKNAAKRDRSCHKQTSSWTWTVLREHRRGIPTKSLLNQQRPRGKSF